MCFKETFWIQNYKIGSTVKKTYRYFRNHDDSIHRHPADGEADSDVDHGSHNVDLCLGQRRWSLLIPDSTTFSLTSHHRSFHDHFSSLVLILRRCSVWCFGGCSHSTGSSDWLIGGSLQASRNLCLTLYDCQDPPVGDHEDDQRYDELPWDEEYSVDLWYRQSSLLFA